VKCWPVVTDAGAVVLRAVATGKEVRPLAAMPTASSAWPLPPAARHVVSRAGESFFVWEALTGRLLRRFSQEEGGERVAALLPDGRLLAASSGAPQFRLRGPP